MIVIDYYLHVKFFSCCRLHSCLLGTGTPNVLQTTNTPSSSSILVINAFIFYVACFMSLSTAEFT